MKKRYRLLALAALITGSALAQRPFGVLTGSAPPDPATVVASRVSRLTALLTLTTAQAAQATTIFTNALNAITPLETTLSGYYTSLHTAVQSNAVTTIDQLSTSIGATTGQITAIQNKADAAFYAILTTAQQTTLNSSGGLGGPGGHGPGPGGHLR